MGSNFTQITKRELDVLKRIASGATNQKIAADLCISPETVKSHVTNLLRKLSCRTRLQAVVTGTCLGLLELSDDQPSGISR